MHKVIRGTFPHSLICKLRDRADEVLRGIYLDYFNDISFEAFQGKHLGHTSLVMKAAAFRFANWDTLRALRDCVVASELSDGKDRAAWLLHPIFYLRFSWPDVSYSAKHRSAFLDSQPHFDRAFGLPAFSFWTALEPVSSATGGICYFEDSRTLDVFPFVASNKYNYELYLDAAPELDPLLRETAITPDLDPGDVFMFDRTVLHGATKPQTSRRVSFDFRLCEKASLQEAPEEIRNLVLEFNRSPDWSNARNLLLIGDVLGASRYFAEIGTDANDSRIADLARTLAVAEPHPELLQQHATMMWQREYQWARVPVQAAKPFTISR
jgi:hypothetical protein